jgi:cell shape-determining protein MreC
MKMNYLLDKQTIFKNKERKRRRPNVWVVLVLIIGLYILGPWIYRGLSGVVVLVTRPVFTASEASHGVVFRTVNFFRLQRSLVLDKERLTQENDTLRTKAAVYESKMSELASLQKIVGRFSSTSAPLVARVFDRPPHLSFDTLLVDIGRDDSSLLALGDKVFIERDILLGEVVQIFNHTSKIKLYSSPGTKRPVTIGSNNIPATLDGAGGGNFTAVLPRTVKISVGDPVLTLGPESYLLGMVGAVDNDTRNPMQTIHIAAPLNVYELSLVEIKR